MTGANLLASVHVFHQAPLCCDSAVAVQLADSG